MRFVPLLVFLLLAAGCASYEYDVVEPPQFFGHVTPKIEHTVSRPPLEYELRVRDNRLVMRVINNASGAITLSGTQSTVVDPEGRSRPLPTLTIAPGSFIQLTFPPPRPRVYYNTGPTFGVGAGTVIMRSDASDLPRSPAVRTGQPVYLRIADDDSVIFWDWNGEGEIRLLLVYQQGPETFTHDFVIRRIRM